jgi:hypothetical protein
MNTTRHNPAVSLSQPGEIVALALWVLMGVSPEALAQVCAMCQTVMPQANDPLARGMFWSVLFLMAAPFVVGGSIGGWVVYRHWRARRTLRTAASVLPLHLAYVRKEGQS